MLDFIFKTLLGFQSNDPWPEECVPADCRSDPPEAADVPNVEDTLAVVLQGPRRATNAGFRFPDLEELNEPGIEIERRYIPLYAKTQLLLSWNSAAVLQG